MTKNANTFFALWQRESLAQMSPVLTAPVSSAWCCSSPCFDWSSRDDGVQIQRYLEGTEKCRLNFAQRSTPLRLPLILTANETCVLSSFNLALTQASSTKYGRLILNESQHHDIQRIRVSGSAHLLTVGRVFLIKSCGSYRKSGTLSINSKISILMERIKNFNTHRAKV